LSVVLKSLSVEGGLEVFQGEGVVENVGICDGGTLGECGRCGDGERGKSRSGSSSGELHDVGARESFFGTVDEEEECGAEEGKEPGMEREMSRPLYSCLQVMHSKAPCRSFCYITTRKEKTIMRLRMKLEKRDRGTWNTLAMNEVAASSVKAGDEQ